jgi:hypothetical protein
MKEKKHLNLEGIAIIKEKSLVINKGRTNSDNTN